MDEWFDVKNYEGFYKVNRKGDVKSLKRTVMRKDGNPRTFKEMILKPSLTGKKSHRYFRVFLYKKGKRKQKLIHRLLAETFLPNPDNLECVDHKNRNTQDNRLDNIRWSTQRNNCINCKVYGKIKHKFIYECKMKNRDYFVFRIESRKEKNIQKKFNKKEYTLQQVIEWRDKYCWDKDIEIIE